MPATTAVPPGRTSPPVRRAWAPPAVTTPGSVQPGNGSTFSYPPVASRTPSARIAADSSCSGPSSACTVNPPDSRSTYHT